MPDPSAINAPFEFSGDRREVDVGMSDAERKVLERDKTLVGPSDAETTLLSAGVCAYMYMHSCMCACQKQPTKHYLIIGPPTD